MARYVDALLQEIAAADPQVLFASHYQGRKQQKTPKMPLASHDLGRKQHFTLYIGGGTPSLLPVEQLERIVAAARRKFCSQNEFSEFTLEANPDDVTPEKLAAWRRLGVNRLSLGVQSFNDAHLRWMLRRHSAAQAETAVRQAREAGFDNISLDLIFGFAGLTDGEWAESIDRALVLRPEHLSCYQMSVEEGSTLGDEAAAGAYAPPAQETCARQYALLQQRVAAAGYRQYEISNFALPGRESQHNSAYWRREPYLGFGPGAHSYDGDRLRRWNRLDFDTYLARFSGNPDFQTDILEFETLSDKDLANETVMLSLRTAAGLDLDTLSPEHLAAIRPVLERMLADGRLEPVPAADSVRTSTAAGAPVKNGLRIPADSLFVSDAIISDLFL